MRITTKDTTVQLSGLRVEIWAAIHHAALIWRQHGMLSLVITSALDGVHSKHSKHYSGDAVDIRSRDLPDAFGMAGELQERMGDAYNVLLEQDHIHIEYDPRV